MGFKNRTYGRVGLLMDDAEVLVSQQRAVAKTEKRRVGRTAWYEGVRVVILCLFLACSKKNVLTLSAI